MTTEPQYEIEERGETEAVVRVTVSPEAFGQQLDAVYRRYAREARIPGFRKGKIPRSVLDTRFGEDVFVAEAQEDLQRDHLPSALVALELRPVSRPRLEVISSGEAEPFVFKASFAVLPEVEVPDYRGREVSVPPPPPVTDEDVQQALREVQSHFATMEEKEGDSVEDGDVVRVREGEREWDTRASADDPVTKELIGAKVGATVPVDVELPEGQKLDTSLEVVTLKQIVLPDIDDEMAKDAGFESLEALRADIDEKIRSARTDRYHQFVESAALDAVVDEAGIPLPTPFVDDLVEEEFERFRSSFDDPGSQMDFDGYLVERGTSEEQLQDQIREAVERRLRRELVLRRIAAAEEIRIDDEALEELAKAEAEDAGEDPMRFAARLRAEERWEDYRTSKVNQRVFELLRETAVVSEGRIETVPGGIIDPSKADAGSGIVIDPTKEGGEA